MSNSPRYVGFLDPPYNVTLTDDGGKALDLSQCVSGSFTLTMLNASTLQARTCVGTWTTGNVYAIAAQGGASYQWTADDMSVAGSWWLYTTVKLPGEISPREFDPELIEIKTGTVGAGAAPPGVLPAPIAKALFFNIVDYGAVGDGITYNDTMIMAAWTALQAAGGGVLYFPGPGKYLASGLVFQNASNFTIKGDRGAVLSLGPNTTANPVRATYNVLTLVNCSDFAIDGLEVSGNRHIDVSWPTADRAPVTQYLQVNAASTQANVTISDGTKFVVGERLWVCGGLTANGATEKDFVDNNSQRGIAINSIAGNVLTLASNLSHNYTATGVAGGAYVTSYQTGYQNGVAGYTLGNEDQQNGIHLINCTRFLVTKCYAHDVWESPIKVGIGFDTNANILAAACTYGLISENRCRRGYDQGVSVWNSQFVQVKDNDCADCGWGGSVLTHSDDCTIESNVLHDNYYRIPGDNSSGYGFVIEGGARNTIGINTMTANYNAGVLLRQSPLTFGVSGVTLNGNVSWGSLSFTVSNGTGFIPGATYMINDGAKSESFKVAPGGVNGNTLTITEKTRYFHASGKSVGVRVAEDNTIELNEVTESVNGYGVWISPGVRSKIRHNKVMRNYNKGILVEQSNSFVSGGTILDDNDLGANGNGTGAQAILIDTVPDVQILNNRVDGNFGDKGIHLKGSTNFKVVGNSVTDVQADGIALENGGSTQCARGTIANNDVKQCDGAGISTQRANHLTITGNNCWANAGNGGMSLGGLQHSTVKGNVAVANNGNGILFLDNNAQNCAWNIAEGNIVRDDGSGIKGSDGTALTQGVAIKLQDTENNNTVLNNQVDHATTKVGAATTITGDIVN